MKFFWQRRREDHEERQSTFGASSFSASSMALLMVAPTPHAAAADQAKLTVSATVLKHAGLKVLAQPTSVVITAEDLARGYVDVAAPAQVAIRSNSPHGYLLEFASEADFMRQIQVRGLATDVQLGATGGVIRQPGMQAGVLRTTLALQFRFLLSEDAHAGSYPWPVHLSVAPI